MWLSEKGSVKKSWEWVDDTAFIQPLVLSLTENITLKITSQVCEIVQCMLMHIPSCSNLVVWQNTHLHEVLVHMHLSFVCILFHRVTPP